VAARDWVIRSKEEARQVLEHHCREERYEGLHKKPDVWLSTIDRPSLIVVVHAFERDSFVYRPYQYRIACDENEVSEVIADPCWLRNFNPRTARTRLKDEEKKQHKREKELPQKPLPEPLPRQLHMFRCS